MLHVFSTIITSMQDGGSRCTAVILHVLVYWVLYVQLCLCTMQMQLTQTESAYRSIILYLCGTSKYTLYTALKRILAYWSILVIGQVANCLS
jgi:hypothetical protein